MRRGEGTPPYFICTKKELFQNDLSFQDSSSIAMRRGEGAPPYFCRLGTASPQDFCVTGFYSTGAGSNAGCSGTAVNLSFSSSTLASTLSPRRTSPSRISSLSASSTRR